MAKNAREKSAAAVTITAASEPASTIALTASAPPRDVSRLSPCASAPNAIAAAIVCATTRPRSPPKAW